MSFSYVTNCIAAFPRNKFSKNFVTSHDWNGNNSTTKGLTHHTDWRYITKFIMLYPIYSDLLQVKTEIMIFLQNFQHCIIFIRPTYCLSACFTKKYLIFPKHLWLLQPLLRKYCYHLTVCSKRLVSSSKYSPHIFSPTIENELSPRQKFGEKKEN